MNNNDIKKHSWQQLEYFSRWRQEWVTFGGFMQAANET